MFTQICVVALCLWGFYLPSFATQTKPVRLTVDDFKRCFADLETLTPLHPQRISRPIKHIGKQNVLVMPFQFTDQRWSITVDTIRETFSSKTGRSLKNYYELASYGQYTVEFGSQGIHEWMVMPKPLSEYKKNGMSFEVYFEMFNDAFKVAQEKYGIDFAEYDEDGNGWPDMSILVWSGTSRSFGGDMPGDFMMGLDEGNLISVAEDMTSSGGFPMAIILHEFFHGLGELYDLYDYSYVLDPVGAWDLMTMALDDRYCGMCGFNRWKADWLELETITEPGTYEIYDLNGDGPHKIYRVPIPGSEQEWILIENRQRHGPDGYYLGCAGEGIVMYHVDDKRPYGGRFNTFTRENRTPGIGIIDPGGAFYHKTANFGKDLGKTKITATTTPNTLPYVKNDSQETLIIKDISNVGPVMTFTLDYEVPKRPILKVSEMLTFGRVEKGKKVTLELPFSNAGLGKLQIFVKTDAKCQWISIDRTSFLGNEEAINVTADTSNLTYGKASCKLMYTGNIDSGFVNVTVDVTPILGDINADGFVNQLDFDIFSQAFASTEISPNFNKDADFNLDGMVDDKDLLILAKNFKQ